MESINKYRYDKKDHYTNTSNATFYRNLDGEESYFHICDNIQPKYMPEVFKHDIHNYLYLGKEHIEINYCPLCGKKLD